MTNLLNYSGDGSYAKIKSEIIPNIQYSVYSANDQKMRAIIYTGSGEEFIQKFETTNWQDVLNSEKAKLTPGLRYKVYGVEDDSSELKLYYEGAPSSFIETEDGDLEIKESYYSGMNGLGYYGGHSSSQTPIVLKGNDFDMQKLADSLKVQSEYAIGTLQDQITQTNGMLHDEIISKNTTISEMQNRIDKLQETMNTIHQEYMKQITTLNNTIAQKDAEIKEVNLRLENEKRFKNLEIENLKNYNDIAIKMQKKEQEYNNQNDVGLKDLLPILGGVLAKTQATPVMAGMSAPPQQMQNTAQAPQQQRQYKKFTPPTNGRNMETEIANNENDNAEFI